MRGAADPLAAMESAMQGPGNGNIEKAIALFRSGNAVAAAQTCNAILRKNSRDVAALYLLALTAMQQQDCAKAERIFAKVTKLEANSAEIWANRGNNLIAMNMLDRAFEAFDRALAIEPLFLEVLYNRGKLLHDAGRLEEALASYRKCLEIMPQFADALNNSGAILAQLDRHDEALAAFDKCLAITPNAADTLNNRGNLLARLERNDEALTSYDKCIAVAPDFAEAWNNVGRLLFKAKRHQEAVKVLGRALELDPRAEYAVGNLLGARQQLCSWDDLPRLKSKLVDGVQKGEPVATPFALLAATESPQLQLDCARAFVAKAHPPADRQLWRGERYAHERIRIAYLSADFRDHPVARLIAGLFEHHDQTKFETTAISFSPGNADEMQYRIRSAFERFIDARHKSDHEVANLLRELEVDIAVDLMGFTQNLRLGILTFRPAPVQVNYLGYPATMGAPYIDYIIADHTVIPAADHQFYSEKVVYLPDSYQANDDRRARPVSHTTRPGEGLPEQGFVFCSFNNSFKLTPAVFDVWMRLLHQVDDSVLWLLADDAIVPQNLRREAEMRGVPASRLVFAKRVAFEDHLARHCLADLFLDWLPYNAHTTASDALWMGLPVVTCPGKTFASRVTASLLTAAGLEELIAPTLKDYEAMALKLARDKLLLDSLRGRVESSRHHGRLFDTALFTRQIEVAYTQMWERLQRGQPPASISVSRIE